MIMIENTLIADDIFEKKFVCDLNSCKGQCCISGDSGAPLDKEETEILENIYEQVKPYIPAVGIEAIEKQGKWVIDSDGDYVTPLIASNERCAYVFFDETKTAQCAIEKAYLEGKIKYQKPISCHLYPIRITRTPEYDLLNYHVWNICKDACRLGEKLQVPVFKFLKEPLIRKYGKEYYQYLEDYNQIRKD